MDTYRLGNEIVDSVELKGLVVSRGVLVNREVYETFSDRFRVNPNPLACNCMLFPDGTAVQLTDLGLQLRHLAKILSWDELLASEQAARLGTPFSLTVSHGQPLLLYHGEPLIAVTFPPHTDFYRMRTSAGTPYIGNAVLQALDWVAFQCLWPCEYAAAGKPCQFCYSGGEFQALAEGGKELPSPLSATDAAEIVEYALAHGANSAQLTGGSTFRGESEAERIAEYLAAIQARVGRLGGELLLYITPPDDLTQADRYFSLGANRIACSIEVWDETRAKCITPGKMEFTTRERHLKALTYIAEKYGPGKAFTNLIIGIEPFETLREGAVYLAERGILPTASVWMPMGRPVMGSTVPPTADYLRRVKELFASLYTQYGLVPPAGHGLNVCIERDIWRYAEKA